jgi:hypothetical protein
MAAPSLGANQKRPPCERDAHRDQGDVMFKWIEAVLAAAAIAGLLTFLTAANGLDGGPLPTPTTTALQACTQQPWPYLNCVGTPNGDPHVRLIATQRLGA